MLAAITAILVHLAPGAVEPPGVTHRWPDIGWVRVEGAVCADFPGVKGCEEDHWGWNLDLVPNDPYAQPVATAPVNAPNRALVTIGAFDAWNVVTDASSVRVGIVDTGACLTCDDLQQNLRPGIDLVFNDLMPEDENRHGTHVLGEIAATCNNGLLVCGVAQVVQAVPIRVFAGSGGTPTSRLVSAVTWATENGIDILNMSLSCLGSGCFSQALQDALAAFPGLVVVSAGNNAVNMDEAGGAWPCSYPLANILCVAASNDFAASAPASFTNWGSAVDLAAPGSNVWSVLLEGHTCTGQNPEDALSSLSGTSMSAPLVSGAAALAGAVTGLRGAALAQHIVATVAPLPSGWETRPLAPGAGILDASAAVGFVTEPPSPACGNAACDETEDCRTCEADCPRVRGRREARACCGDTRLDPGDLLICPATP